MACIHAIAASILRVVRATPLFLLLLLPIFQLAAPASGEPVTEKAFESVAGGVPYVFQDNAEFGKGVSIPVYQWMPNGGALKGMALAIHGLTLHGRRYELLGRAFAASGYCLVAPDMRGFGRCYEARNNKQTKSADRIHSVNYSRSCDDIASIARRMKEQHPDLHLIVIGESLGATMAVRLAGSHPELVDGLIISGPAMQIHPRMIFEPSTMLDGLVALLLRPSGALHLEHFMRKLISTDPDVIEEVSNDPLVRKHMTIFELIKTSLFIDKTCSYARKVRRDMPVLVLQGSLDRCVVPYMVVELCRNIRSADQTVRWLDNHSHLMLETSYVKGAAIKAIIDWFNNHTPAQAEELRRTEETVRNLGGHIKD